MDTNSLNKIRNNLENRLSDIYPIAFNVDNRKCFLYNNIFFVLDSFFNKNDAIIVVEYEENIKRAKKGLFGEDGDCFYPDEMSEDDILNAIISEVAA